MTTAYIYRPQEVRPLLHGLMAHIGPWWMSRQTIHGHRCTGCEHSVACWCGTKGKFNLVRCPWCTPWVMEWAPARVKRKPKPVSKPRRRRTTRRVLQPVP